MWNIFCTTDLILGYEKQSTSIMKRDPIRILYHGSAFMNNGSNSPLVNRFDNEKQLTINLQCFSCSC